MRTFHLLAGLLTPIALPATLVAQGMAANPLKHDPQPTTPAVTAADLMTRLYIFADDSMMGREAGTLGNAKGVEYIARELARIGLTPGGDSGTFFQTIPLTLTGLAEGSRLRVDGVDYNTQEDLVFFPPVGALNDMGGVFAAESLPVVYGGKIGDATLVSPDAVAGRLVLFAPSSLPNAWQFWSPNQLSHETRLRYARAAGILVASRDATPPFVLNALTQPSFDLRDTEENPRLPYLIVSSALAERLMGAPLAGLFAGTEGKRIAVVGGYVGQATEAPARNVVAIVEGSDPALRGQYVAFGAHNDHDGVNAPIDHDSLRTRNEVLRPGGAEGQSLPLTPEREAAIQRALDSLRALRPARLDSVMNGADDDGSGSMALLELAEYLIANRPRRSLLFVWHVAEEKGLFGARYFADRPTVPRDSIVTQLNIDMIGRGKADDLSGGGPGYMQLIGSRRLSTQLGDLIERVNREGSHGFTFDYQYDANGHPQQYYCRSDHYEYAKYGIPVAFFSTGGHRDYHMPTDEPQYIDYTKFARVTSFIGAVGAAVANLDARPTVDKPKPDPRGQCVQ